jgi:CIC family chloride channel protein
VGLAVLVVVSVGAVLFARLFKESTLGVIEWVSGTADPTQAARDGDWWVVATVVAIAVAVAAVLGVIAKRRAGARIGLTAVAAAARGEGTGPSVRATLLEGGATWVASTGLASLGRELAIVEVGGAFGAASGRKLPGFGPSLAAGGIAAAFASAYHAPFAAMIYVEGHLAVRRNRRSLVYTVIGAALSHAITVRVFDGGAIFPGVQGSTGGMVTLAAVGLVPALVGSRIFLELRDLGSIAWSRASRASRASPVSRSRRRRTVTQAAMCVVIGAVVVASVPMASGNGMEALRAASTDTTVSVALALALAKLAATAATLRVGVPGGVFSPSLAVSAGWALLAFIGLDAVGVDLPGARWDGMIAAMAVGVAVGLGSPLLAAVVIPEMVGSVSLFPVCALVSFLAWYSDRRLVGWRLTRWPRLESKLRDDDA